MFFFKACFILYPDFLELREKSLIASTHLAVAAASGLYVQKHLPPQSSLLERMAAGFCAGVASHIIVDSLRHKEYSIQGLELGVVLLVEIVSVFAPVFYFSRKPPVNLIVFLGMAGGAVPDLLGLSFSYVVSWRWLDFLSGLVHLTHGKISLGFEVGFVIQVILAILAVLFIKFKLV